MSGHSKWAGIKHKKAAADKQRAKIFGKLIREITVAARTGGGKPEANPRLRVAVTKAADANMPKDKIEQAIRKGTGTEAGVAYEEIAYEGYGPKGVAVMVEALTDNKNRTTSDVRNIFAKYHGNLAGEGSVAWIFQKRGYFVIAQSAIQEERLMEIVLEAGAEDVIAEGEVFTVTAPMAEFDRVKQALAAARIASESAELAWIPSNTIRVEGAEATQVLTLVEALEDHDDVQNVAANFDIPDDILQAASNA